MGFEPIFLIGIAAVNTLPYIVLKFRCFCKLYPLVRAGLTGISANSTVRSFCRRLFLLSYKARQRQIPHLWSSASYNLVISYFAKISLSWETILLFPDTVISAIFSIAQSFCVDLFISIHLLSMLFISSIDLPERTSLEVTDIHKSVFFFQ